MRKKTIVSRIMNNSAATKLRSNSGESIVETLVTMIILSLAVVRVSGAVVTSARVNQRAENDPDKIYHVPEYKACMVYT